jgi:hypothetical protein
VTFEAAQELVRIELSKRSEKLGADWHDLLTAHILVGEAEDRIEGKSERRSLQSP